MAPPLTFKSIAYAKKSAVHILVQCTILIIRLSLQLEYFYVNFPNNFYLAANFDILEAK